MGLFAANVIPFVGEDVWLARAAAKAVEERTLLRSAAEACDLNSFTADTPVTMADGTSKPISQVRVGERVLATDPQTGKTQPRPVAAIIVHAGTHLIVELTFADGSRISATDHHPFWDATTHRFTDAIDLHTGDQVLEPDGTVIPITALSTKVEDLTAYNLTITGTHTYYAGTTPILVHNSCGRFTPDQDALIQLAKDAQQRMGGLTADEGAILKDWADEYELLARGPETHPGRGYGSNPHYHIGPIGHILVR